MHNKPNKWTNEGTKERMGERTRNEHANVRTYEQTEEGSGDPREQKKWCERTLVKIRWLLRPRVNKNGLRDFV